MPVGGVGGVFFADLRRATRTIIATSIKTAAMVTIAATIKPVFVKTPPDVPLVPPDEPPDDEPPPDVVQLVVSLYEQSP